MLYAEDLSVGRAFEFGSWTMELDDIMAFARAWDPMPFHVDREAAAASRFGGIIASGLHTQSVCIRLAAEAVILQSAIVVGREVRSLRMHKPVYPGTTLTGDSTVIEQRMREHDGRGVVVMRHRLLDEEGDVVLTMDVDMLVAGRPD